MASAYSDEEFQDAVSTADDTTSSSSKSTKTSEQIEDLTKELHEAKINKEEDEEADEFKPALENEDDDDNDEEEEAAAEELSIEELQRLEKDMTAEQLEANKKKAEEMKLDANELFKNDKPEEAIHLYSEALNICPSANSKERAILFANRAAAKIKIDAKKSAVEDCTKAIELWPEYVRCLLRRAKLYETLDKLDEALEDYKRIAELDPGQREAREAMVRLPPIIAERNEKLKAEMVSKLKDLGNMFLKPFGLSTANFQMQQDPNSGSYSINFKQ